MFNSNTSNFPGGVTNAQAGQTMANSGVPDPTFAQTSLYEFNTLPAAADFTTSLVGAGTLALSGAFGPGGVALLTTTAGATDAVQLQTPTPSYQLTPNKHQFHKARLQCSSNLAAAIYVGLAVAGANAPASADCLMLYKPANSAAWWLRSVIASVVTDSPLPAGCVMVDGQWLELGVHCDAGGAIEVFWNPTTGNNRPASGSFRGRVASFTSLNLTQALMSLTVGVVNGAAVARTLAVDYLVVSAER